MIRAARSTVVTWKTTLGSFPVAFALPGSAIVSVVIAAAAGFFDARGLDADWSSIEDAPDTLLVTSLAMVCPFDLREKQALLECDGPTARAALLIDLLEMSARGMAPDPGAASH